MRLFRVRPEPIDPRERVDRFLYSRRLRVVGGIYVDPHWQRIALAVIQGAGHGKYLRLRQLVGESLPITTELGHALRQLSKRPDPLLRDVQERGQDLAMLQGRLIAQARLRCGKLAEQWTTVAVHDPGIWLTEFDGRSLYVPVSSAETLAGQTGVCVIDALPAKDLAAGGHGWPLTPLPIWIALADRRSPVATESRVVVEIGATVDASFLPPSDGLDDIYPNVQWRRWNPEEMEPQKLAESLVQWAADHAQRQATQWILSAPPGSPGTIVETAIRAAIDPHDIHELTEFGLEAATSHAVWVALLGSMHIDQMPATLPWLTGSENPRILGRVTPGSPASWRQLVRDMADHHPPAMRLRDAV